MLLYHVVDGLTDSFFPALSELDDRIDTRELGRIRFHQQSVDHLITGLPAC